MRLLTIGEKCLLTCTTWTVLFWYTMKIAGDVDRIPKALVVSSNFSIYSSWAQIQARYTLKSTWSSVKHPFNEENCLNVHRPDVNWKLRTPIQLEASLINYVYKTRKHFVSQKTDRLTWKFHWLCPTAVTILKTRASSYSSSGLENAKARAFLTFLVFGNPSGWKEVLFFKMLNNKVMNSMLCPTIINDHHPYIKEN